MMANLRIEAGSADNLPEVMRVMNAAFDPRYGEAWTASQCLALMTMPGTRLLLARDETLVGFALTRTVLNECELMMLGVDPAMQRHGVGTYLLDEILKYARAESVRSVFLEVRSENPAIQLYTRSGFEKVGVRLRYYCGNNREVFDAETFRRELR
jgi:ribosomal-protein-alanine N-acetyltransferase